MSRLGEGARPGYEPMEYTPYGELWVEHGPQGLEAVPYRFTGKELDQETGLYYYGARYLNPRTSRWISPDPAMKEYLPVAPVSDGARSRNVQLPGEGGVFNIINLSVYHYAGNNPLRYYDPTGNIIGKIAEEYRAWKMQNEPWKGTDIGNGELMRNAGCKALGGAMIASTIAAAEIDPNRLLTK